MFTDLFFLQSVASFSVVSAEHDAFTLVSSEGHRALLPRTYLSDYPALSALMSAVVKKGDILKDLVCISQSPTTVRKVTRT